MSKCVIGGKMTEDIRIGNANVVAVMHGNESAWMRKTEKGTWEGRVVYETQYTLHYVYPSLPWSPTSERPIRWFNQYVPDFSVTPEKYRKFELWFEGGLWHLKIDNSEISFSGKGYERSFQNKVVESLTVMYLNWSK